MTRVFALILWFKDEPIKGNVINLTSIKSPRKELTDYKVGDIVQARCQGYGIHEGVLAKIADEGHQKALRQSLCDGPEFENLVRRFCAKLGPEPSVAELPQVTHGDVEQNYEHGETVVATASGKKGKKKAKKDKTPDPAAEKKDLQKAASDLELTELQTSAFNTINRTNTASTCSISSEDSRTESSTCTVVGESLLSLLDSAESYLPTHVPDETGHLKHQIVELNRRVQVLEERQVQTENNLQWLWNSYQQVISSQNQQSVTPEPTPEPANQATPNNEGNHPEEPVPGHSNAQVDFQLYNGYTKDQLRSKMKGVKEYSKASKLLFRSLYSEAEYTGRSLGGNKANKNFGVRPALEHPGRLEVLYDLIKEVYPGITEAMIKTRLREILKPSRFH